MKKYIGFVLAGVAVLVLGGCGEGTNDILEEKSSVNIENLKQGYTIEGHNTIDNTFMELDFCEDKTYIYDNQTRQQQIYGNFNINRDGLWINMWYYENNKEMSTRLEATMDGNYGYLIKNETYELVGMSNYTFTIDAIYQSTCQ